ncbi:hypothetical protein [Symbioplanes lichenis]|uniref:hypothetical protein n=1 Tax=Symbioplanes lichenis TaxID=1629072 RepID=UPI002739C2FB|nr:hypothetical protein [Actinoplanes lichenis]
MTSLDPTIGGPEDLPPTSSRQASDRERDRQSAEEGGQDAVNATEQVDDDRAHHKGKHRR